MFLDKSRRVYGLSVQPDQVEKFKYFLSFEARGVLIELSPSGTSGEGSNADSVMETKWERSEIGMSSLVIFGAGGHAKSVFDSLEPSVKAAFKGFVSNVSAREDSLFGYDVTSEVLALEGVARKEVSKGFVAVGDNEGRRTLVEKISALNPEFEFVSVINPLARVSSSAEVGKGVFVGAFASVGPSGVLEDFSILNTGANLEHDAVVESYASVGPGAQLAGRSHIGSQAAVGMNASVLEGVKVGPQALIGAGSVIAKEVFEFQVVFGPKAEIRRVRQQGDSYLK